MTQHLRHDIQRAQISMHELADRIQLAVQQDGSREPLQGLHVHRVSAPTTLRHSISGRGLCIIAQGSKQIFLNNEKFQYDPARYLLVTAELPLVSQVVDASITNPYLSLRLELDPVLVGSVIAELDQRASQSYAEARAVTVSALDANLLDAVVRFVRLVDTPAEAVFLGPMIMREIVYRLLTGEHGSRLRHIAIQGTHTHRITRAMARLRQAYDQPLHIDDLAGDLGMSVSSFHHHFKAVTAMSPLQFQKRLQLQEARRLMLGEALDVASAAYKVGYSDTSQFSREYKKLFGLPPRRDVERLRDTGRSGTDLRAE